MITKTGVSQASAKGEHISNLDDAFHIYINYGKKLYNAT